MIPVETKCRVMRRAAWVALFVLLLSQVPSQAIADGFYATGSMTQPSVGHTATLLENGKVLIVGEKFANLYDPATGQFTLTAGQPLYVDQWNGGSGRLAHSAIRLQNGKVLIVGGGNYFAQYDLQSFGFPPPYTIYAELYDPATDSFTRTGSMITERDSIQPVLLPDGRVLIAGGQGGAIAIMTLNSYIISGADLSGAEIYDPSTGLFSTFGDPDVPNGLNDARGQVNVAPLADGRILFAGGTTFEIGPYDTGAIFFVRYLSSADIYDPVTQTFTPISPMNFARPAVTTVRLSLNFQVQHLRSSKVSRWEDSISI